MYENHKETPKNKKARKGQKLELAKPGCPAKFSRTSGNNQNK
jgi:hypothetical protein